MPIYQVGNCIRGRVNTQTGRIHRCPGWQVVQRYLVEVVKLVKDGLIWFHFRSIGFLAVLAMNVGRHLDEHDDDDDDDDNELDETLYKRKWEVDFLKKVVKKWENKRSSVVSTLLENANEVIDLTLLIV